MSVKQTTLGPISPTSVRRNQWLIPMELSNHICLWPEWTNHDWHFNRRL